MLELKQYQKDVLEALEKYLALIPENKGSAKRAFIEFTDRKYNAIDYLEEVPYICVKVPTGGGKTLIATHAADIIYRLYLRRKNKTGIVMWLTPSDAIRTQTLEKLKNINHAYREVLDMAFSNRVKVFDADEALRATKNDVDNYLCIFVSTLQAFRRENTESLRNYRANGYLITHFDDVLGDMLPMLEKYEGTNKPVESLSNVIKMQNPLVVVDEGHNVHSELSYDMLRELNPSFIIEYTATPLESSNVLISIGANRLKEEEMVKIPVIVHPFLSQWEMALSNAIDKRNELEALAQKEGEYLRPIMLLQAQEKRKQADTITVDAVKKFLIQTKRIPAEQVAVKAYDMNDIGGVDLFSEKCPVRYIITISSLAEGWDCSFAYVLASVAHKRSKLDVAQILGRILRQPNAKRFENDVLNKSYVYTSSEDTEKTLASVVDAMRGFGYEEGFVRTGGEGGKCQPPEETEFPKAIEDEIEVPLFSIMKNSEMVPLGYRQDLCPGFNLSGENYKVELADIEDMMNKVYEIDVEEDKKKEGGSSVVVRPPTREEAKIELELIDEPKTELIVDITDNIQFRNMPRGDISRYVLAVVNLLLEKEDVTLEKLIFHKYALALVIKSKIQEMLDRFTKAKFEELKKANKLKASVNFDFPDVVKMFLLDDGDYQKHYYARAHYMNNEERVLAEEFERHDSVAWWLRNIERKGFFLQGYYQGRFYPDFIAKTKKGNYFVVEYKGEHLETAEDAQRKKEIGEIWQSLTPDNYFFRIVTGQTEIDELMEVIGKN